MSVEIPLTQGLVALVDDEDAELVQAYKWYAHRDGRTVYAMPTAGQQNVTPVARCKAVGEP